MRNSSVSGIIVKASGYGLVVECDLPKVETRVRFSLPALKRINEVTNYGLP